MIKVTDLFNDMGETLYAFVEENSRGCYMNVNNNEFDKDDSYEEVANYLNEEGITLVDIPFVENASPAIQLIYKDITHSANCMVFIDNENLEDMLERLNISQEEFENQIDNDIKKFHLETVVEKNSDEDIFYTFYGEFQQAFTQKV